MIKALLLDVEAAIPVEAVLSLNDVARNRWISQVKFGVSLSTMKKLLLTLQSGLKPDWVRLWFNSYPELFFYLL